MSALTAVVVSWAITLMYVILLVVERNRGERYGDVVRSYIDRMVVRLKQDMTMHVPSVNHNFFKQLLHYGVHRCLSFVLRTLERIERMIRAVVRINRKRAVGVVTRSDSHLQKIIDHKEGSALSEAEKIERKEAALRGG